MKADEDLCPSLAVARRPGEFAGGDQASLPQTGAKGTVRKATTDGAANPRAWAEASPASIPCQLPPPRAHQYRHQSPTSLLPGHSPAL